LPQLTRGVTGESAAMTPLHGANALNSVNMGTDKVARRSEDCFVGMARRVVVPASAVDR
jgi:hypothetical protein